MKRVLAATLLALLAAPAHAWEPETTHAGLAEQAALASELHKRLESIGFAGGLYEQLTIPPADAPGLLDALKQLPASQGGVPDARGRQPALEWLVAGAELADTPVQAAANHFYDVQTHGGWVRPDLTEMCDGIDNNCDGQVDEGCDSTDTASDTAGDKKSGGCGCATGGDASGWLGVVLAFALSRRASRRARA